MLSGPAILASEQQAQLQLRLGNALSRCSRNEDAIHVYKRAVALNPKLSSAWEQLSVALMQEPPQPIAARAALQQAIKLAPRDATRWAKLSANYAQERQYEDAIVAQRRAIELAQVALDPIDEIFPEAMRRRQARYYVDLAQLLLQLDRHTEVLEAAATAIAILKDTSALEERTRAAIYGASSYWQQGNRTSAVRVLKSATTLCDEWDPTKAMISSDEVNANTNA